MSAQFHEQWKHVKTLTRITRRRTRPDNRYVLRKKGKDGGEIYELNDRGVITTEKTVHYISSKALTVERALARIGEHWDIESQLG